MTNEDRIEQLILQHLTGDALAGVLDVDVTDDGAYYSNCARVLAGQIAQELDAAGVQAPQVATEAA